MTTAWIFETRMASFDGLLVSFFILCNKSSPTFDVFAQEDITEVWQHLEAREDRMFRLRLIWLLQRQKRDEEIEKAKNQQMHDLMNGIKFMDVSEPEDLKEARGKAVLTAKCELSDLMAEMSNLSIQRKEENRIQSHKRTRAVFSDWVQFYN